MAKLLIGLDMSLTSPAAAAQWVGDENSTCTRVLSFQQRKTDKEVLNVKLGDLRVTRIRYDLEEKDRFARCAYIVETIVEWIKVLIDERDEVDYSVHAYIEGYALGMAGSSSSVSKLCELGGILRYALWCEKWTFNELSPTTVKKHFTGSGRAKKPEMLAAYLAKGYPLLNETLNTMSHQHPNEDIHDAVAVLYAGKVLSKNDPSNKRKTASTTGVPKRRRI
jgi:Holliday junction resolvasome RuvABC endonuclease subunit